VEEEEAVTSRKKEFNSPDQFVFHKVLGKGNFGKVQLVNFLELFYSIFKLMGSCAFASLCMYCCHPKLSQ
jgi:hypothetical protein